MILEIFLVASCALYALNYVVLLAGRRRVVALPRRFPAEWPSISILVAARNEQRNIRACLQSLLAQDYPADRLQLIAMNDESEDETLAIMQQVAAAFPERLRVVSTVAEASAAVRGKARALAQGIDHATGEILLFTDADCTPPPTWARSVVQHLSSDVDVATGFTIVGHTTTFGALQALDWLHLHAIASAALQLGVLMGCIGNNFAIRRSAYQRVGGYRGMEFSVTEDFALFAAVLRTGGRGIFHCHPDAAMQTEPCPTLPDVLRQKQRWARGGIAMSAKGKMVLVIAVLMMASITIAPFHSLALWGIVWGCKFVCDLALMVPTMARLRMLPLLRHFLLFEFYFIAQALVTPLLLFRRTVVWKGREYQS
ncbi:MAG: glycosyltransferase [Chlorobi bacterium]|nr:glycosyltransferase [Chlorobiota bacterium]MBX7215960.1 glycosyltransferase [Candidatus Kapabacteria bacterium]